MASATVESDGVNRGLINGQTSLCDYLILQNIVEEYRAVLCISCVRIFFAACKAAACHLWLCRLRSDFEPQRTVSLENTSKFGVQGYRAPGTVMFQMHVRFPFRHSAAFSTFTRPDCRSMGCCKVHVRGRSKPVSL